MEFKYTQPGQAYYMLKSLNCAVSHIELAERLNEYHGVVTWNKNKASTAVGRARLLGKDIHVENPSSDRVTYKYIHKLFPIAELTPAPGSIATETTYNEALAEDIGTKIAEINKEPRHTVNPLVSVKTCYHWIQYKQAVTSQEVAEKFKLTEEEIKLLLREIEEYADVELTSVTVTTITAI
jgi:hypothetical protein